MTRAPATIGVCAIFLLGLAMSACSGGGANDDCKPGVCVGSTPGSTPDSIQAHENLQ